MHVSCCIRNLPLVIRQVSTKKLLNYNKQTSTLLTNKVTFTSPICINHVRFVSNKTENNNLDDERVPVYNGMLSRQIKTVKVFSLSSSVVGIAIQPLLYKELAALDSMPALVAIYTCVGFFTLVTPVLLHFITKKYVTQLYYQPNRDSYIAKTLSFFCTTKETEFTADDVKVPDVPGMFTTFFAKGTPMFMDPRMFEDPKHYIKIMGYDKPIDFKLNEAPPDSKK